MTAAQAPDAGMLPMARLQRKQRCGSVRRQPCWRHATQAAWSVMNASVLTSATSLAAAGLSLLLRLRVLVHALEWT